ncbi:hypothetical protein [Egbenema bharatensis]|uniref:hypothetical protein n=1 Tax=Egbenema bharatensis TaxID=3463334 RepID=UPI003A8B1F54
MGTLHQFFFKPLDKTARSRLLFWQILSLTVAAICPIVALEKAFGGAFIMQDDARQHVFWMSRFVDPELFPGDAVADYFQSVAPWGYAAVYRLFAVIGISPILLHKLLPIGLALITTAYAFGLVLRILPIPFVGFLTTAFLNQNLWMRDDIVSATPVAFVYPLFLGFLYYLVKGQLIPCLIAIVLQGLFYPQCVFIYSLILLLRVVQFNGGRPRFSADRQDYWFCVAGLGAAFLVLLPYALKTSAFGPVISATEARSLFTFSPAGWSDFFAENPIAFWFCGKRSGMLPMEWCTASFDFTPYDRDTFQITPLRALFLPQIWLALSLPVLLKFKPRFPLTQQITPQIRILPQTLIASVVLFFVAHALLFRLHLPNRYTEHSFRILLALAAGLVLAILLERLLQVRIFGRERSPQSAPVPTTYPRSRVSLAATLLLLLFLIGYPTFLRFENSVFPVIQYSRGWFPDLYEFLAAQPKDSLIASIDREVNNLPSFTQRSILTGTDGFILPYHLGYYQEMSQRITDLITAQYSLDLSQVQQVIQTYGIDFWVVNQSAFKAKYLGENRVFQEYADTSRGIRRQLRQSEERPALERVQEACTAFQNQDFAIVNAGCVLEQTEN